MIYSDTLLPSEILNQFLWCANFSNFQTQLS